MENENGVKIGLSEDDVIDASVCDALLGTASTTGLMSQSAIDDLIRGIAEASRATKQ